MKLQEARQGVPTQHLSLQIFNKATGDRGAMMVLGNLVLKTNLKLGGINHEIVVSPTLLRSNPSAKDLLVLLYLVFFQTTSLSPVKRDNFHFFLIKNGFICIKL